MKASISMLPLALILVACDGDSSSPTQPSVAASSGVTHWNVSQRFVSLYGPDNCWIREQRVLLTGAVFPTIPMTVTVTRSGDSITLESDFFEAGRYTGTLSGNDFLASGGPLPGGGMPCQDGTLFEQLPGVSDLSGRFSDNGQQLRITEMNSYRLTSGELVIYTWDWKTTRQN